MFALDFEESRLREPIFITDLSTGRVSSANRAACVLLGRESSDVIGKTTVELGLWQDEGQRNSFLSCLAIEGSVVRYPVRIVGAGGQPVEAFVAAEPCGDPEGARLITRLIREPYSDGESEGSSPSAAAGFLSRSATKFLVDDGSDFYQLVAQELRTLIPHSLVVVSSYDAAAARLSVMRYSAPDRESVRLSAALETLRKNDSVLVGDSTFASLLSGGLFEIPMTLVGSRTLGEPLTALLREFEVETVLLIGLAWHGTVYGAVTLLLRSPDQRPDRTVVEAFVRQASVALQRNERSRALRESLEEKETLLREIHHRVKNNLQIVASLLKLQGCSVSDPSSLTVLAEAADRVQSMALVHTMLYDNRNLSSVDGGDFLRALSIQIVRSGRFDASAVILEYDLASIRLDPDHAVPVGLIVTELVTNALKYGMRAGTRLRLAISFRGDGAVRELAVSDSGAALPADFDPRSTRTLGMQLVQSLVRQLRGTFSFSAGGETSFRVHFTV